MSRDPGLQSERTELAWLRAMLGSWAATLVVIRAAFPLVLLTVIAPATVTAVGWVRRRRLRNVARPRALPRGVAALTVGACLLIALAGALR